MKGDTDTDRPADTWNPLSACPPERTDLLRRYSELLGDANRTVNLISRDSAGSRWTRHILHSLCLGFRRFPEGARVVDWGTGGGLPLIPLAIAFPGAAFVGVDGVRKKVIAVRSMIRRIHLQNAEAIHVRAESWDGTAQYSVSRATAPLSRLWGWHVRVAMPSSAVDGCWPPGLICLKGGDLSREIDELTTLYPEERVETVSLADHVPIPEFVDKYIVTVNSPPK